jgi:hypothetical protein
MVHHLIKSRRSTLTSHYGEPYSGIEYYEMKGLTIEITRAGKHLRLNYRRYPASG